MPALKPRYEIIAQALASGATDADAYRRSGFSYKPASAFRVTHRADVQARVQELKEERRQNDEAARRMAVERSGLSKEWIIERLKWLTERSLRGKPILDKNGVHTGQFSGRPDGQTAVRCLTLAAQISGLLVARHEVGDPGAFARLSDAELDARLRSDAAGLGMPPEMVERLLAQVGPVAGVGPN